MRIFICLYVLTIIVSCKQEDSITPRKFSEVKLETILEDSLLNIRSIEVIKETKGCYFLTSNGYGGLLSNEYEDSLDLIFPIIMSEDLKNLNFRSSALTSKYGFGLTIGNPALLFRMKNDEKVIAYKEEGDHVFYDSIDFWNDNEGIAIGDPTEDCMSVIITRDGGESWVKLPCDKLPKVKEGEAAFAASDTNIVIVGDHTWVATGGKSSRVMYSPDKGKTWTIYDTPIVQGQETTGLYSIDFYDDLNGYGIGGDYTKPDDNNANKIVTKDGGKTWQLVGKGEEPGYRSCVQYIPERNGKELVAIGFKGIDYSNDGGFTWKHLSDEGFYTIRFLNDSVAYAAGKGRISKLIFSE